MAKKKSSKKKEVEESKEEVKFFVPSKGKVLTQEEIDKLNNKK